MEWPILDDEPNDNNPYPVISQRVKPAMAQCYKEHKRIFEPLPGYSGLERILEKLGVTTLVEAMEKAKTKPFSA